MQFMLLIYEDESIYGPGKNGPAMQQIVAEHMAFNRELGGARIGGAGLKSTASATTVRTAKGKQRCGMHAEWCARKDLTDPPPWRDPLARAAAPVSSCRILCMPDERQVKSRLDRLQQGVMRVEGVVDHTLDPIVGNRDEHNLPPG